MTAWGRGAVYSQDELLLHICAAHGASFVANGKDWLICGGGRPLADLSAKSMLIVSRQLKFRTSSACQTERARA